MPRFPVIPQRTSAPAAFSNTPRAQAAHFGAGIGRSFAALGSEAVEFGQEVEKRQKRQVEQALSRMDRETAKQRLESDAQAPPEETGESRIERYGALFDSSADAVLKEFEGQALQGRVHEGIEARRETMMKGLLEREAQQRLRASLKDTQALVGSWSGRVAQDPSQFEVAILELLGDDAGGAAGLLNGLGLRPEALTAWKTHSLKRLLAARAESDPSGLLSELETERWQEILPEDHRRSLIEDAQEAQQLKASVEAIELGQQRAGKAQQLSADIEAGRAGQAEIRRAEEEGTLSIPQAEALRGSAERAEVARQAQQVANDELALAMSGGVGFDLENPQNRQAADAFYEKTYSQALREGGPEEIVEQVVSMVAKTGYLPPRLAKDTTGLLLGRDEAAQVKGAELYGRLREVAPNFIEDSIDLEARAWGGALNRWLDAGLQPSDALARATEELPDAANAVLFDDEETAVLQRDLESLFIGENHGHRVGLILDRLETKFLDDLAQGITPQMGRVRARRDLGRVMHKVSQLKSVLDEYSNAHKKNAADDHRLFLPVNSVVLPGPVPLPIPPYEANQKLSSAAALELERGLGDWARRKDEEDFREHLEDMEALARTFPSIAEILFAYTMLSLGDGKNLLGKILQEDPQTGIRSVVIDHPDHGRMTVRQQEDITTERHNDLDVTFWDRKARKYVTEKLPSSRFTLPLGFAGNADEVNSDTAGREAMASDPKPAVENQARVVPPDKHFPIVQPGPSSDPIPVLQLPPFTPGKEAERIPNHTGGDQIELGPRTDQPPGFPAQEQEPLVHVSPDQSEELSRPSIVANQDHSQTSELLIEEGKQGKHIIGHNNFEAGRSEFTHDNPQSLVEKFAGSGQAVNQLEVGQPGSRERVDFGEVIGVYKDESEGISLPTTVGIIHYSKKGVHIVPARPKP